MKIPTLLLLVFSNLISYSQDEDYYGDEIFRYENFVYDSLIKTVQLNIYGNVLSAPIIQLNGNEKLLLSFDDLGDEQRSFHYEIVHCTADWKDSELFSTEYINGIPEDVLYENTYSRNYGQDFIHHWLVFPTDNMKIIRSGNYLIKIYEENNPEKIVLTWRFMVTENRIEVDGRVFPTLNPKYKFYKQELNFTIHSDKYFISNPYDDLKVTVLQNGRWDNAHYNIQPTFVKGNEIEYSNQNDLVFNGGNEFRHFDIKNLTQETGLVKKYFKDSAGINHIILEPENKRAYKVYSSYYDINGKTYIKNDEWGNGSGADADYAWVHFTFPIEERIPNGDVYIYGELTNWLCLPDNKMIYDNTQRAYVGKLYLKQGYYNYEYVFLKDGESYPNETLLEGMHSETENDYTILIYHRQLSDDYDRLIGAKTLNSVRTLQLTMPK